jgi:hypothetical protein
MPPSVEEDQQAGLRADDRVVSFHRSDAVRIRIVREDEFPARALRVVGKEEKTRQRIRVDMAFEPHLGSALDVQDDAVPFVGRRPDGFGEGTRGQLEKALTVALIEPGKALPYLVRVYSATPNTRYVPGLAREHRGNREGPALSLGGDRGDLVLPAPGKLIGHVEFCPAETQ